jgi:hypothetical protein
MDMWKEKLVGSAAERHATWLLEDLLLFRRQAGAVICHPAEGFFPSRPWRKRQRALAR